MIRRHHHILTFILLAGLLAAGSGLPAHETFAAPAEPSGSQKDNDLFLVAQKAFDDGFYDVAIRYIDQLFREFPGTDKRVQANLILGQCYFFKNQYLKAFDIFKQNLEFQELKDATLFWLGETYLKGSDYAQARKSYQQLIDLYPDSPFVQDAKREIDTLTKAA